MTGHLMPLCQRVARKADQRGIWMNTWGEILNFGRSGRVDADDSLARAVEER